MRDSSELISVQDQYQVFDHLKKQSRMIMKQPTQEVVPIEVKLFSGLNANDSAGKNREGTSRMHETEEGLSPGLP